MKSDGFPESWAVATLEEVAYVNMGQSPKGVFVNEDGEGIPFYQGKAEFGKLYPTPKKSCTSPTKIAETGDILISVRAPVGPTNICRERSCIGRGLASIRAYDSYSQDFLHNFLRNLEPWLSTQGTGSTFKAISGSFLREQTIPVPPYNEQVRIANKLDELLAQVETIKARVDAIPAILKRFRQSVLAAAVSGKLTEDWRANNHMTICEEDVLAHHREMWISAKLREFEDKGKTPKNRKWQEKYKTPETVELEKTWPIPPSWCWTTIDALTEVTKLAGFEFTKYVNYEVDGDLPVVKAENVGKQGYRHKKYSYVCSRSVEHLKRSELSGGEILIVFVGAGVGQVGLCPTDRKYFLGPNVAVVRNTARFLEAKYLEHYLRSDAGKGILLSFSKGAAQPSLSMGQIRKASLPLPSIEEQVEIVKRIDGLFLFASQIEQRLADAQCGIDKLMQAILTKAFRGELVDQDPNDEPASELLTRIQIEREAAVKLAKAVKKATSKSRKNRSSKA